jgi:hypothetical protein
MDRTLSKAEHGLYALVVCALFVAPMSVLSAASDDDREPWIAASHRVSAVTDSGDGTRG